MTSRDLLSGLQILDSSDPDFLASLDSYSLPHKRSVENVSDAAILRKKIQEAQASMYHQYLSGKDGAIGTPPIAGLRQVGAEEFRRYVDGLNFLQVAVNYYEWPWPPDFMPEEMESIQAELQQLHFTEHVDVALCGIQLHFFNCVFENAASFSCEGISKISIHGGQNKGFVVLRLLTNSYTTLDLSTLISGSLQIYSEVRTSHLPTISIYSLTPSGALSVYDRVTIDNCRLRLSINTQSSFYKPVRFIDCQIARLSVDKCHFKSQVSFIRCQLGVADGLTNAVSAALNFASIRRLFVGDDIPPEMKFNASCFESSLVLSESNFLVPLNLCGESFKHRLQFEKCSFDPFDSPILRTNPSTVSSWNFFFRLMRCHFSAVRDFRQESYFYIREQRARRSSEPFYSAHYIASFLYDVTSDFGSNLSRVTLLLFCWNAAFCLFFSLFYTDEIAVASEYFSTRAPMELSRGVILGLQNALNAFSIFSAKGLVAAKSSTVFYFSLLQSIGSLSLFAIFILCLRGNFRRGGGSSD